MKSLIRRLQRTGNLKVVSPLIMMRARRLYVTKLRTKEEVCRECEIDKATLERWIFQFCWNELREKREYQLYQRVSGIRRRSIPNIDEKHDLMFHNLESLIEDTVYRIKRDGLTIPAKDLTALAGAARICMDCRRTIHKKEGPASRHVVELQDHSVFNEFAAMLTDVVSNPTMKIDVANPGEVMKQIPYSVEDQEYEDQKDSF